MQNKWVSSKSSMMQNFSMRSQKPRKKNLLGWAEPVEGPRISFQSSCSFRFVFGMNMIAGDHFISRRVFVWGTSYRRQLSLKQL
jgi:hypothetical protein